MDWSDSVTGCVRGWIRSKYGHEISITEINWSYLNIDYIR